MAISITAQNRVDVSNLYVALFGRAPDGEGLGYWANLLANGTSLSAIADSMFAVPAARAYYPSASTNQEIIDGFYQNVLGRAPDAEGSAYWTAQLNAPGSTPGSVITSLISAVVNFVPTGVDPAVDAAGTLSKALFLNKADVAVSYGLTNGGVTGAETALDNVTADPASVAAAKLAFAGGQGASYSLTVSQDSITGSIGADTFKANVVQNALGAQVNTFGSGDELNGGNGTDTLVAKVTSGAYINGIDYGTATMPIHAETKSIEIAKFTAVESGIYYLGEDNHYGQGYNTQVIVEAKDMENVTQLWSAESRADLTILNMTTKGVASLLDQTIRMDHTGNGDSHWGASDYTVYYDQDYLTAGTSRTDQIEIRLVNNLELKVNNKGLVAFEKVSFKVGAELVTVDITPAIRALTGADAYNALVAAIQAQLTALGITDVTVSTLPVRSAVFTDDLGGFLQGETAGNYTPILLTSTGAPLERGQAQVDNTTLNFNGLNTQLFVTESTDQLVTINVALEKVGLAGDGGHLIIGSMNKDIDNVWHGVNTVVDETTSGIQQFNTIVYGANNKSSSLAGLQSTNNNLRVVNVTTDSALAGTSFADLTIGNSNTEGYHTDVQFLDKSYEVDRPDADNQYALKDVQTFNASGLKGDLTLFAALTNEVTAKYLNVVDDAANPAADNVAFVYTSGTGNDYINMYLDPSNMAQPGTVTREDMTLTISTGLGDDEIVVGTGDYFGGESGSGDGPDWYQNQHINANLKMVGGVATGQLQLNGNDGNDIIRTLGTGDYAVNGGTGLDTVYLDNTGGRATWAVNAVNDNTNSLVSFTAVTVPQVANLFLNVSFKGFEVKNVSVGNSSNSTTGVSVTDLTINQAIKAAINGDPVMNKLLIAEDGPGRTLIITSLIDGTQQDTNQFSDVVFSLSSTALSATQIAAGATALSALQATSLGFGTAITGGFGATAGGRFDADLDDTGSASAAISDNLVVGGLGNDVMVLGTGYDSNDTVGYAGFDNGRDTIVNFNTLGQTFTTVVDTADVTSITQGTAAVAASPGTPDSFTLQLTGTVAAGPGAPGAFTLDQGYMGGAGDVVFSPTVGQTAAQVAAGLAAANNTAANLYTAVANGDSVTFTQNSAPNYSNVANPTLGNDTTNQVSYDGSGIGVVNLTGTNGSPPVVASPAAGFETFTVFFGDDTVLASSYTFDGVSVPVLVGEAGANIAAAFAAAFPLGGTGTPNWDVLAYTAGSNSVTFTSQTAGNVPDVTDASFVGANLPYTPATGIGGDKLDFSSYLVKGVMVGAAQVAGVAAAAGQTYVQMTESTTNAGEYTMSVYTEAGAVDTLVGLIGVADFGATQPFTAANFVI